MTRDAFMFAITECAACYGKSLEGTTVEAYYSILGGHHEHAVTFALRQATIRFPRFFPTAGQISLIISEWYEERNEKQTETTRDSCPYDCSNSWISVIEINDIHADETGKVTLQPVGYRNFDVHRRPNEKVKAWPCPHCRPVLPSGRANMLPPGVTIPEPPKRYRFTQQDLDALIWLEQFGFRFKINTHECEPISVEGRLV